jgi:hypothetical protein
MTVTNKYLKSSISEISNFYKNNTKPPEDMYLNLLMELKVSELLIPVVFDGEKLSFPNIEVDDGTSLIPLFTSNDELKKYSDEFESFPNEIAYYIKMVNDFGFDGILIDAGSDEFCIDNVVLNKIPLTRKVESDNAFDGIKLRDIALSEKNEKLKRFISKDSNFNKFDKLSKILLDSVLLNVVVSEKDLSEFAHDGVIDRNEADTFTLFTKNSGRDHYGTVYTDTDAIVSFHEDLEFFYYVQVTNKYSVFHFLLSNDLDGIIINPGTDDYYVPRQVMLRLLNDDLVNTDFAEATRYAFPIE